MTRKRKTPLSPKALQAEEARLARLCKSIHKHRAGLDFAVEESFGGELDRKAWREAFESSDPHDTIRTMAVTGSYSAIVNASVEILKVSSSGSSHTASRSARVPSANRGQKAVLGE
jgi:hypothetical protein